MRSLTIIAILIAVAGICQAATIRVPQDQPTIQLGIDAAVDGDTVLVAPQTYTENIRFIGKKIVVTSTAGPNQTVIQALDPSDAVVRFIDNETREAVLSGFTITDGGRSGIYCSGSSPTIADNVIYGNTGSSPAWGGGLTLYETQGSLVEHNRIFWNSPASYGGGIHVQSGINDTLRFNEIYYNGGYAAVWCHDCTTSIYNNTLIHDTGGSDVACVITNDSDNSVFVDVRNNILHGSCAWGLRAASGEINSNYNLFWDFTTQYGTGVTGMMGDTYADPLFVDVIQFDWSLQDGSPCIDAGDPNPIYNDPDGSRNDIGALPFGYIPDFTLDLISPRDDSILTLAPTLVWNQLPDTTVFGVFQFTAFLDSSSGFATADSIHVAMDTSIVPIFSFLPQIRWHWKVRADSDSGYTLWSQTTETFFVDDIPTLPAILLPDNGTEAIDTDWLLWTESEDLDPDDSLWYQIQLDDASDFGSVDLEVTILSDSLGVPPSAGRIDITGIQLGHLEGYASLFDDTIYNWRLRAFDKYGGTSAFTTTVHWFFLNKDNTPPAEVTVILSPLPDQPVNDLTPTLTWQHASDPDLSDTSDKLRYRIQVDVDQAFNTGSFQELLTSFGQPNITTDSLADEILHYWRIMTEDDDGAQSDWSATFNFWTNYRNDFPTTFSLQQPENNKKSVSITPELIWETADDHDPVDAVTYTLVLALDPGFLFKTEFTGLTDTSYTFATELSLSENYWWKVKAEDNYSGETWSTEVFTFRTLVPGDADGNGALSIGDAVFIINYIFGGGSAPDPLDLGDADCNGSVSIGDAVYIINFIFGGGPEPCVP